MRVPEIRKASTDLRGGLRTLIAEITLESNPVLGQFRSLNSNWDQGPPPFGLSKIRIVRI